MIGYITLGTSDIKRGAAFYDAIAAEMDTPRMMGADPLRVNLRAQA